MQIRHERQGDEQAIAELTYQAFLNHPHHEPGALPTEHHIVERLRSGGDLMLSLVMELEGEIVGHVAISPISIAQSQGNWVGLGPISVLPQHQGLGIGKALMNQALEQLEQQGIAGVVLIGDPAYYNRFGFNDQHHLSYLELPKQFLLAKSFTASEARGEVVYSKAFG
ncbi:GNAT family N-acetyltransferase [Ferrimonas aestuarii]|uniref:N-acetyltransferase n=1 Tax=Ferrimonas aestuarii TaxID=2569539 RepID=A0A4U1BFQ0_9GAMM|nr:N-acetyltransferase [Ferrimonas aestuarii]TKB50123.1 N-acetyltransferase [Ferrimonas aestuarii]